MYDPLKPYTMTFEPEQNIEFIMVNAETALLKATHNYECSIELERRSRKRYYDKYHSVFLDLLSGKKMIGEKRVVQSILDKTAKALCNDEYVSYENAVRESKKNEEKMNSIKKLLDQRTRIGG